MISRCRYVLFLIVCTFTILFSVKINTNAATTQTFAVSAFYDRGGYIEIQCNTGAGYNGKHFHFVAKQSKAVWTLTKTDGTTYSSSGDFYTGDQRWPAWSFSVGDDRAFKSGYRASSFTGGSVTITYNAMENCTLSDWVVDKAATCTEAGLRHKTCSVCFGSFYDTINALDHNFEKQQSNLGDARGCYKTWNECTRCGKKKNEKTIQHEFTRLGSTRTQLTCTQNETQWKVCGVCGYQSDTKYQTTENAPGHNWVWEVDTNLSCTSNYTGHKKCTRGCHDTYVDGPIITASGTVFAKAPGHNYTKFVCDKKATCTEPGYGHYECSNVINGDVCGARGSTVTIPATGHHITYDKVTEKPTVYTNGTRTYYCEYCNQAITTRDVLHRNFNIYLGGKRVTMISKGDDIVWNGSYGEQGSDGGKTSTDNVNSLVESNWYYDY